jgi:hypothetical protein
MASSPTQRTLKALRDDGWRAAVVERWCPHSKRRHDLFGFIDVLAIRGDDTLAVQATSTSNVSARVKKMCGPECVEAVRDWLSGDRRFVTVVGWRKYAKPVDLKLWRPTWRPIEMSDLVQKENN